MLMDGCQLLFTFFAQIDLQGAKKLQISAYQIKNLLRAFVSKAFGSVLNFAQKFSKFKTELNADQSKLLAGALETIRTSENYFLFKNI